MADAKLVNPPSFPALVQQFFVDYLLNQRAISPSTIASYRDAMLLFLDFAHARLGKAPSEVRLVDLAPDLLIAFLDDLEQQRGLARVLACSSIARMGYLLVAVLTADALGIGAVAFCLSRRLRDDHTEGLRSRRFGRPRGHSLEYASGALQRAARARGAGAARAVANAPAGSTALAALTLVVLWLGLWPEPVIELIHSASLAAPW